MHRGSALHRAVISALHVLRRSRQYLPPPPSSPSVLPFLAATAATATVIHSDTAATELPRLDLLSTPLTPLSSPHGNLLRQIADANPSAIHTLTTLPKSTQQDLLRDGLILSLSQALHRSDQNLTVSILKLLADLAETPQNHSYFNRNLTAALQPILNKSAPSLSYFSWIPFLSSTPSPVNNDIFYHASRCISALATNSTTHTSLLAHPLLPPLIASLNHTPEDDLQKESLRYSLLAVCALSKSASEEIVKLQAHHSMIRFASNPDARLQTIAMGGLKNMASNSGKGFAVHRELVVSGVCAAIEKCLKADGITKLFAIRAWADIMATGHEKRHLIHRRMAASYSPIATLLNSKDPQVVRTVSYALRKTYAGTVESALSESLGKNIGQWVNGPVKRGDVAALNSVVSMASDAIVADAMVDTGVVEVLTRGVKHGKGEYWEKSIAALAVLSEHEKHVDTLVNRGALKAMLKRPFLDNDAEHSARFLANVARKPDFLTEIAHNASNVLLLAVSGKREEAKLQGARGLYNLALGGISKVMAVQRGALPVLIKAAKEHSGDVRRLALAAIAEMSDSYEQATKLIEAGVIDVLLAAVKDDESLSRSVSKTFGNISMVPEVHGSLATSGALEWMVSVISRIGGKWDSAETMLFCMIGVTNVVYSPGVARTKLVECDGHKVLASLTATGMSSPIILGAAKQALKNLKGEGGGLWPMETRPGAPE